MKKLKWFTLVEILIVIVIIGILIWALVPRMQWAQWRARDVARKNDLNQLQWAIIIAQNDNWQFPGFDSGADWLGVSEIQSDLLNAWLNSVPADPLAQNVVSWLWSKTFTGTYWYMLVRKDWGSKAWFVLMAKTETEWGSNYVVCGSNGSGTGKITSGTDVRTLQLCGSLEKVENDTDCGSCKYSSPDQLRYVMAY